MTPEGTGVVEEQMEGSEIMTHTPASPFSTPRSGRKKKKGALAKLAEKKRKASAGLSDIESSYGSAVSLQTEIQNKHSLYPKLENFFKEDNSASVHNESNSLLSKESSVLEKSWLDVHIDSKPIARPLLSVSNASQTSALHENMERNSSQMISEEGSDISNSTLHKLRSLKVVNRTNSVESLKNSPFSPRPPSTPRKTPPATPKGEKRTLDPYSSGEDQEKESANGIKAKRQILLKNRKTNDRPETNEISGENDLMLGNGGHLRNMGTANSQITSLDNMSANSAMTTEKETTAVFLNDSVAHDNMGPRTFGRLSNLSQSEIDVGSASDLQDKYREILSENTLQTDGDNTGLTGGSTSRTGRLTPLSPKHPPPPLPMDYSSRVLRTANKTDSAYRLQKFLDRPIVDKLTGDKPFDTVSQSMASTSALPLITTKEAKSRSYLLGSISSNSALLGSEELERYFPDRKLHIFVGSWNMAELKDCSISLDDFILPDSCDYVQDVYVIGTQENSMDKKEWEIKIQETLGPSHVLFHSATHGALHLAVFIRRDLIWFCSVPESDIVSTRAVTMVKTKGAVAIYFRFFGTSLLFINSHFTSDDSRMKERIADYQKIIRQLKLPRATAAAASSPKTSQDVTQTFDAVFWCGDLNFRIDRRRDHVENMLVIDKTQEYPNFENLIASDQLTICMTEGHIFQGFQEGRISFKPTYKFDKNSDKYDTSNKLRIPSYTDRVLFRSKKKNSISCILYDAAMNLQASDHRPVFGLFETTLRPGRDNIPLAAGQFDRPVYVEANRRRALYRAVQHRNNKSSSICSVQ